jgi:hypothetical protein
MATRFGTECISAGPYLKIERFNTRLRRHSQGQHLRVAKREMARSERSRHLRRQIRPISCRLIVARSSRISASLLAAVNELTMARSSRHISRIVSLADLLASSRHFECNWSLTTNRVRFGCHDAGEAVFKARDPFLIGSSSCCPTYPKPWSGKSKHKADYNRLRCLREAT